ncbi:MAG: 50S ribosomal protein L32e [Thermoplasmata archaeon]|nr:50S ribosomal protein L32e [Thermoplasmata archaeon]
MAKEKKENDEVEEETSQFPINKIKPELSDEEKWNLWVRSLRKRKEPNFYRQEWFRYKRIKKVWRRPRGLTSKMRKGLKYRPPRVKVGYRGPRAVRGRHPSGFEEVLVHNPKELEGLDPKKQAVRIAHGVGTRKRREIIARADEMNLRVLNRGGL